MSGIYIPGMEMPKNCEECAIKTWDTEDYVCPFSGVSTLCISRQSDCPLVSCDDVVMVHKSDIRLLPTTNADRIRSMTDEELVHWIVEMKITGCPEDQFSTMWCDDMSCVDCWLGWLKTEI